MKVKVINCTADELEIEINGQLAVSKSQSHSCRRVFLFDDFVVKLDNGACQNLNEIEFYEHHLEAEDVDYFPRLIDYHFTNDEYNSVLIQERVEINEYQEATRQQRKKLQYLIEKYNLIDLGFLNPKAPALCGFQDFNHNVTPIGEDGLKIWDIGSRGSY